jgi:hypothetical protein
MPKRNTVIKAINVLMRVHIQIYRLSVYIDVDVGSTDWHYLFYLSFMGIKYGFIYDMNYNNVIGKFVNKS